MLADVTDSQISDNTAVTVEEQNDPYPQGFGMVRSKNNIISNNTISGVYTGMWLTDQSTGNYVAFNTLSPGTDGHLGNGIFVNADSNNNNFHGNTLTGPTG
jgi:parallel beta-helix repeat protein